MFRSRLVTRKPARTRLKLESFESRIVPAAVVRFFEADGDKIIVRTNRGTTTDLLASLTNQVGAPITEGMTGVTSFTVNLIATPSTATAFAGTNLRINAVKVTASGNSQANFVTVNAFDGGGPNNIDLNNVNIKGRLVHIDAGNANLVTPAINNLIVTEFGPADGSTSATVSQICGNITSIKVKTNFNGYIESRDTLGIANYQSANGTAIRSFTAKNMASADGTNVGRIQAKSFTRLTVTETFGVTSLVDGGLIEAVSINKLKIKLMTGNARIQLG